jgi:uncharacterized protein (TIGR02145 family)
MFTIHQQQTKRRFCMKALDLCKSLTASIMLAMVFTFISCANNYEEGGGNSSGSNNGGSGFSSSSDGSSSSSDTETGNGTSSSVETSSSSSSSVNYTDKGNSISSYRTVTINGQVWMAENLNYKVAGSKCYGEGNSSYSTSKVQSNCDKYGRLYDWSTAMALSSSCNSTTCSGQVSAKHQGICPNGWHIPSNADLDKLMRYVDGSTGTSSPYDSPTAGRYLKATSGWSSCGQSGSGSSYLCEDMYGFSALPGGYGYSGGYFYYVGDHGFWWSASEGRSSYAYGRYMYYSLENAFYFNYDKDFLHSVRCLQD